MSDFKESSASGRLITQERKRLSFFGLPFTFTKYLLTEKKLIVYSGFFTTTEEEILLYRVLDISRKRNLFQKMFGLGTITLSSQDKSMPVLEIKNVKNSNDFKNILSEQVECEKKRMNVRAGEFMGVCTHDHHDHGPDLDYDHDCDFDNDGIPDHSPDFHDGYNAE